MPVASSQQFPRTRRPEPVLITEAQPSLAEQHAARKKRYAITMAVRGVCIVLAAVFYQIVWLMLLFAFLGTAGHRRSGSMRTGTPRGPTARSRPGPPA